MKRQIFKIAMVAIASTSFVVDAHVLKDYKNKQMVLNSVYDAIKNNVRQDMQKIFNKNEINYDSRNKRNTADKPVYYDNQPSESSNDLALTSLNSDLVCTRRGDYTSTKVATNDHTTSGLTFALILKYGLMLLAALALPLVVFKAFILPMAILLGLKAATLLNSLLLGSLLYKYKYWRPNSSSGSSSSSTNTGTTSNTGTTNTGTAPVYTRPVYTRPAYSGASVVATTTSTLVAGNNLPLGDETVDYVDIAGPGEDLSRALKLLKKKNKNW